MMKTVIVQWALRLIGYGAVAASTYVAAKTGDAGLAEWVATGVSLGGALVLNKATPIVFPTKKKIAKALEPKGIRP